MKIRTEPIATDTQCPHKDNPKHRPCCGTLHRTDDGASKLSERLGRIILKCDRCGNSWSTTVESAEFKRKP